LDDDYVKEKVHFTRDEHGSGPKLILAGSDCIFLKIGWSGMDRTEKIIVVFMWIFWRYQTF